MSVIAYLNFKGNTKEVMEYYIDKLEVAEYTYTTFSDLNLNGEPFLENELDYVANASIKIADGVLLFSDVPKFMEEHYTEEKEISISIALDDLTLIEKYFNALANDGKVLRPLQQTPRSKAFGIILDKHNIQWRFNYRPEVVS